MNHYYNCLLELRMNTNKFAWICGTLLLLFSISSAVITTGSCTASTCSQLFGGQCGSGTCQQNANSISYTCANPACTGVDVPSTGTTYTGSRTGSSDCKDIMTCDDHRNTCSTGTCSIVGNGISYTCAGSVVCTGVNIVPYSAAASKGSAWIAVAHPVVCFTAVILAWITICF